MKLLSFYTQLVSIGWGEEGEGGWWQTTIVDPILNGIKDFFLQVVYFIVMTITGALFSVLSYCYKVFQLVCSINTSTMSGYFAGISNGITAVIIVIVVYNLATTIIKYLINPEEAKKSSPKVLRDIFVTAALLLSYSFIFALVNEVVLLALGNQTSYSFPILSEIIEIDSTPDSGIVNRLVFGEGDGGDIGETLACSLFELHVQDDREECSTGYFKKMMLNWEMAGEVGSTITVSSFFIIGQIIAGIMIWNLLKLSCSVIVRVFKLIVLQICAPVAIVSILTNGMDKDDTPFRKFVKSYLAVVVEIFVRLLTLLIVIVFIIKFMRSASSFVLPDQSGEGYGLLTLVLLVGIMVWACFTFLNIAPAFIDETLGTNVASSMGNIGNGLIGATSGLLKGWKQGKENQQGLFGRAKSALLGASEGYDEAKSRGPSIGNIFKAIGDGDSKGEDAANTVSKNIATASAIAGAVGGVFGYENAQDKYVSDLEEDIKNAQDYMDTLGNNLNNLQQTSDNLTSSRDQLQTQVDNMDQERTTLLEERDTLTQQVTDYDRRETQLTGQLTSLDNVEDAQTNLTNAEATLTSTEANLSNAEATLSTAQADLSSIQGQIDSEIQATGQLTMDANAQLQMREPDGNGMVMRNASEIYYEGFDQVQLGNDRDAYVAQMVVLDKEASDAQAQVETLIAQGADSHAIAEAKNTYRVVLKQAEERAGSYYDERKTDAVTVIENNHRAEVDRATAAVSAAEAEVTRITAEVDTARSGVTTAQHDVEVAVEAFRTAGGTVAEDGSVDVSAVRDEINTQITENNNARTEVQNRITNIVDQVQTRTQEIDDGRSQIVSLDTRIHNIQNEIVQTENEIANQEAIIKESQEEIETIKTSDSYVRRHYNKKKDTDKKILEELQKFNKKK